MTEPDGGYDEGIVAFSPDELEDVMGTGLGAYREAIEHLEPEVPEHPDPGALEVRPEPCATCPYRRSVPSGVWAEAEYAKLEAYDGPTGQQAVSGGTAVFHCHSTPELVCAGWAAVAGTPESIALRIASATGHDVRAVLEYHTEVPLWASGHEAAEHGRKGIEDPGEDARAAVDKVSKAREATGRPVRYS